MTQLNPNWVQALTYSARLDRQVIKAIWTEGVLSGMQVSQRASGGPAMFVDVAVGTAVIYGDDQTDQGAYLATITVLETVAIAAAPGSNSRKDLVYLRINDPNAGGPAGSNSAIGVVTGTASASPVVPALPTSAIPLAVVSVATGQVQVVDANILSARIPAYGKDANPPGTPMLYFGTEAGMPADCVVFAGQSISKNTYWRAYYFLGDTYGATSTNFTLPDMRGRMPLGLDNMGGSDAGRIAATNTLGGTGGSAIAPVIAHRHDIGHDHPDYASGSFGYYGLAEIVGQDVNKVDGSVGSGNIIRRASYGGDTAWDPPAMNIPPLAGGSLSGTTTDAVGGASVSEIDRNLPPYILCNWIGKF